MRNLNKGEQRQVTWLVVAGILPFLAHAILALSQAEIILSGHNYALLLNIYAAVIISFVAGMHWGIHLMHQMREPVFITSNVFALAAWAACFLPTSLTCLLHAACIALLWRFDKSLSVAGILHSDFYRLRVIVTIIVAAFLLLAGIGHLMN